FFERRDEHAVDTLELTDQDRAETLLDGIANLDLRVGDADADVIARWATARRSLHPLGHRRDGAGARTRRALELGERRARRGPDVRVRVSLRALERGLHGAIGQLPERRGRGRTHRGVRVAAKRAREGIDDVPVRLERAEPEG